MGRLWACLSLFLALSCAGPPQLADTAAELHSSDTRPGIRLVLEDHLSWPYELSEITVFLDGELQYRRRDGPVNDPLLVDYPMTDVSPVGDEHTLQVRYAARYQSGTIGSSCEAGVAQAWSFRRTRPAAQMTLRLLAPGPTESFDALGLALSLRGATGLPLRLPSEVRRHREVRAELSKGCARYSEPGQAVCRTQARLEVARADRDIILVNALNDRITRMKALRRIADQAEERANAATDPDIKLHQSQVQQVALSKITAEFETVKNGLVCEYPAFVDGPEHWVSGSSCAGLAEIDPLPTLQQCGLPGRSPLDATCWSSPPTLR